MNERVEFRNNSYDREWKKLSRGIAIGVVHSNGRNLFIIKVDSEFSGDESNFTQACISDCRSIPSKVVQATDLAKKMYPDAIIRDDGMLIVEGE